MTARSLWSIAWRAATGLLFLIVYVAACEIGSRALGRRIA